MEYTSLLCTAHAYFKYLVLPNIVPMDPFRDLPTYYGDLARAKE